MTQRRPARSLRRSPDDSAIEAGARAAEESSTRDETVPFFRTAEQITLSAHILSVSAALVGVCLTVIGIIQVVESMRSIRRIEDNLLAVDSIAFLAAVALSYGAIRSTSAAAYHRLERAADACFLTGLSFMAVICVLIAYEVA